VTITFERPADGATREYTANNSPDGSWYLRFTLHSANDIGRWNVTSVVDQTGAHDECTDRVTIRAAIGMPSTSTADPAGRPGDDFPPAVLVLGAAGATATIRRRQPPPSRPVP